MTDFIIYIWYRKSSPPDWGRGVGRIVTLCVGRSRRRECGAGVMLLGTHCSTAQTDFSKLIPGQPRHSNIEKIRKSLLLNFHSLCWIIFYSFLQMVGGDDGLDWLLDLGGDEMFYCITVSAWIIVVLLSRTY